MDLPSWDIPGMRYGSQWRNGRRLLHEFLNVRAVNKFDDYQYKYTRRFLSRLAETPENFLDHVKL